MKNFECLEAMGREEKREKWDITLCAPRMWPPLPSPQGVSFGDLRSSWIVGKRNKDSTPKPEADYRAGRQPGHEQGPWGGSGSFVIRGGGWNPMLNSLAFPEAGPGAPPLRHPLFRGPLLSVIKSTCQWPPGKGCARYAFAKRGGIGLIHLLIANRG